MLKFLTFRVKERTQENRTTVLDHPYYPHRVAFIPQIHGLSIRAGRTIRG
jgi:hypothetical protein